MINVLFVLDKGGAAILNRITVYVNASRTLLS